MLIPRIIDEKKRYCQKKTSVSLCVGIEEYSKIFAPILVVNKPILKQCEKMGLHLYFYISISEMILAETISFRDEF